MLGRMSTGSGSGTIRIILFGFVMLVSLLALMGCAGGNWSGRLFSYPVGSDPDQGDWDYLLDCRWSTIGAMSQSSEKRIRVIVKDSKEEVLLDDHLRVRSHALKAYAEWTDFETIVVSFDEITYANPADGSSGDPLIHTTRESVRVTYRWDAEAGRFERSAIVSADPAQ